MSESRATNGDSRDGRNWLPLYVRAIAILGTAVTAESLYTFRNATDGFEWIVFAVLGVLAIATASFSIKIGTVSASITVSDTFFITAALLFGPEPATLAVCIGSVIASCRRRHSIERVAFNSATTSIGMWLGSHAFFWLSGLPPLMAFEAPVEDLILPMLALTGVYFVVNSGLIAVAIGFDVRRSPLGVWREHFSWLSATYFAAASVSLCLVLLIHQSRLTAVIVGLPLLVVLHLTLHATFGRLEDARTHLAHLDKLYFSTVETLAMAIDAKDDVTHSHVRRVQSYSLGLARALGVEDQQTLKSISAAALLHDTGKLAVPEHILNKPGKLSPSEFEQMKRHVDVGADILSLVDFPYPVVPIVRCHHENWDGSGYPRGVVGADIPIGARILSVADCFDALTSDRPYRAALTNDQAFEILRARSGTMYEPRVVETFIRVYPELVAQIDERSSHRDVMQQINESIGIVNAAKPQTASSPISEDAMAFVRLARLVSGEAALGDVLAVASSLVGDFAPNATIAWYLWDESTGYLVLTDAAGPDSQDVSGTRLRIGDGLTGWVAANRQTIINSEGGLDFGHNAKLVPGLESALSVPLVTGDVLVGVITLYKAGRAVFTQDQARLIELVAPHLAQTISTVRRKTGRNSSAVHASSEGNERIARFPRRS